MISVTETRAVPLAELKAHPRNSRRGDVALIAASLVANGQYRPIIVGARTGHVLAGNHTFAALQQLGEREALCSFVDATPEQERRIVLVDNRTADAAGYDLDALSAELDDLRHETGTLEGTGWTDEAVDGLLADVAAAARDNARPHDEEGTGARGGPSLADRFLVPPFSVLDARQGYWQDRKRAWIATGIRSEVGRGDAPTGGSQWPADTLGPDGKSARADLHAGVSGAYTMPAAVGAGGLNDQLAPRAWRASPNSLADRVERAATATGETDARIAGVVRPGPRPGGRGATAPAAPFGKAYGGGDAWRSGAPQGAAPGKVRRQGEESKAHKSNDRLSALQATGSSEVVGETPQGTGTSIFDPVLTELLVRWFSHVGAHVLDPFAGGSVRGIVAGRLGRRYTGVELRGAQVEANREQAAAILKHAAPEAQAAPPGPSWARGFAVADLEAVSALFHAHDDPFVYGRFGRVTEAQVADWAAAREIRCVRVGGALVAAIVVQEVRAASTWRDFAGTKLADLAKGHRRIVRAACAPEWAPQLAALLREAAAGRPTWARVYQESPPVRDALTAAGFHWIGSDVSAASEILGVWATDAEHGASELRDLPALVRLNRPVADVAAARAAIERLGPAWEAHYSTYNVRDSWHAVALRGYGGKADFIEKPAEMSKAWKAEHPEALGWAVADTPLAAALPEVMALANAIPGHKDRIRLMRLRAGGGELTRHADITDPDAGTAPGKRMRIHVPITTNEGVRFTQWLPTGEQISAHMGEGEAWYLDTRKPHTAANAGDSARIHLVMDVQVSARGGLLDMLAAAAAQVTGNAVPLEPLGETWAPSRLPVVSGAVQWIEGDSRAVIPELVGPYDMICSCPPYADLEVYSDDAADISGMAYPAFLEAYREIIAAAVAKLRDDAFACWVVGDIRDERGIYRHFVADTIAAFEAAGAAFYNDAVLITSVGSMPVRTGRVFTTSRKLCKGHQNVLVFVKGDPKRAAAACGDAAIADDLFAEGPPPAPDEDQAPSDGSPGI